MMRRWLGRQIARYEHAARRAQLPIWIVIAINTTLEVIFDTVPVFVVAAIYAAGMLGAIMLGYVSHKVRVGAEVTVAQFDIEHRELWDNQNWVSAGRIAHCISLEPAQLAAHREKYEKRLNIWEEEKK
jgi:hypothetical protein